ncbi:MAG: hypothetical protein KAH77_02155 [Thiomargarita sp.]|nr:hypothetical protein [Thiomargarita sp.]
MLRSMILIFSGTLCFIGSALADKQALNNTCVGCHININPGIIKEFIDSPMANPPEKVDAVVCADCHGNQHTTATDYQKATMPTAETCGECHIQQFEQLREGKHNLAWFGMKSQIAWHGQPTAINQTGYRGCIGCHKIGQKGLMGIAQGVSGQLEYDDGKEIEQYHYGNAQCDACHTRHSFRKTEAQDPRACSNCHRGFEHPQWEMYMSSKHGIIWDIEGNKETRHGRAPTCQYCHMSEGDHRVITPWGFLGLRIPTKRNVLALIKAEPSLENFWRQLAAQLPEGEYMDVDDDPQWVFDRALILQATGILDANFQPTQRFTEIITQSETARGPEEFNEIRRNMKEICHECHAKNFVTEHFKAADNIIKAADHEFAKAILAVQSLYQDGILEVPKDWTYAPDILQLYNAETRVEQELYLIMLEYRQRAFQGAFHASNHYMHWYGWAPLKAAVNTILEESKKMRAAKKKNP